MAVTTLNAQQSTSSLVLTANTWVDLVPQAAVTGTGDLVSITANVFDLDPTQVQTRILIDDVDLAYREGIAGTPTLLGEVLSSGSHTINFQAYSFVDGQVAGNRFLLVLNLT